jgi:hypothetical protein
MLSDDATLVCDGSDVGKGPVSVQGARAIRDFIQQQTSRWLGDGALIQIVHFKAYPGILAYRNNLPVSSIFLSPRNGAIESVRVITCPVRLRSLLVLS